MMNHPLPPFRFPTFIERHRATGFLLSFVMGLIACVCAAGHQSAKAEGKPIRVDTQNAPVVIPFLERDSDRIFDLNKSFDKALNNRPGNGVSLWPIEMTSDSGVGEVAVTLVTLGIRLQI